MPYTRQDARHNSVVASEFQTDTARGFIKRNTIAVVPTETPVETEGRGEIDPHEQYMRQLRAQDKNLREKEELESIKLKQTEKL